MEKCRTQNRQSNSENQEQSRNHNPPRLHTTLRSYNIKTRRSWYRNRPMGQWKRTETLGSNPHTDGQLIFYSGSKNILSWPQISFGYFCMMLWKNLKEQFGQPNTSERRPSAHQVLLGKWYSHRTVTEIITHMHTTHQKGTKNGLKTQIRGNKPLTPRGKSRLSIL